MGEEKKKSNFWTCFGVGCLVIILVGGGGTYYVAKNWKSIFFGQAFKFFDKVLVEAMAKAEIPAAEQAQVRASIKTLAEKVKREVVSPEQAEAILKEIFEGPLVKAVLMRGFEVKYVAKSTLSDDEKKAALITTSRFTQGLANKLISDKEWKRITDKVTAPTPEANKPGKRTVKDSLTAAELTECLAIMKASADKAGIVESQFTYDIPAELQKAIDRGLQTPTKKNTNQNAPVKSTVK